MLLAAALLFLDSPPSALSNVLSYMLKISTFCIVPLVDLGVTRFLSIGAPSTSTPEAILAVILVVLLFPVLTLCLLLEFFELRLLRKKTIFWNVDNGVHYYGILYQAYKAMVIAYEDRVELWCLIGLVIWFYHR